MDTLKRAGEQVGTRRLGWHAHPLCCDLLPKGKACNSKASSCGGAGGRLRRDEVAVPHAVCSCDTISMRCIIRSLACANRRTTLTRRGGWTARSSGWPADSATTARTTRPPSSWRTRCPSTRSSCSTCAAPSLCRCEHTFISQNCSEKHQRLPARSRRRLEVGHAHCSALFVKLRTRGCMSQKWPPYEPPCGSFCCDYLPASLCADSSTACLRSAGVWQQPRRDGALPAVPQQGDDGRRADHDAAAAPGVHHGGARLFCTSSCHSCNDVLPLVFLELVHWSAESCTGRLCSCLINA